jgi:hypothetical protein
MDIFDDIGDISWEMLLFIVGIPCVFAIIGYAYYRWTQRLVTEEKPLYFSCPGCRHKLRYRARQAGHRGMCNNCKTKLKFPEPTNGRR